jgi:cytochrome c oxidase cbb3-type subunit 3
MSKDYDDKLLKGEHDGIEEFDNALPNWWLAIFYLSVFWGIGYVAYYHFGPGLSSTEQLEQQMANHQQVQAEQEKAAPPKEEVDLLSLVSDSARQAKGQELYQKHCAACHAEGGKGLVGPNLTDAYWIHGGTAEEILTVIEKGVLEKGMLAWKGVLPQEEIYDVTAYVWSLKGKNLPGKAPEGEKS